MRRLCVVACLSVCVALPACAPSNMAWKPGFDDMFSMPREPQTALAPGQTSDLNVPAGKKVLITDVYIENLAGGSSTVEILEQQSEVPDTWTLRYRFKTDVDDTTIINFTTGLPLGDEHAIGGAIRVRNNPFSQANVLVRLNGFIVP